MTDSTIKSILCKKEKVNWFKKEKEEYTGFPKGNALSDEDYENNYDGNVQNGIVFFPGSTRTFHGKGTDILDCTKKAIDSTYATHVGIIKNDPDEYYKNMCFSDRADDSYSYKKTSNNQERSGKYVKLKNPFLNRAPPLKYKKLGRNIFPVNELQNKEDYFNGLISRHACDDDTAFSNVVSTMKDLPNDDFKQILPTIKKSNLFPDLQESGNVYSSDLDIKSGKISSSNKSSKKQKSKWDTSTYIIIGLIIIIFFIMKGGKK